jgi:hypothetical protein
MISAFPGGHGAMYLGAPSHESSGDLFSPSLHRACHCARFQRSSSKTPSFLFFFTLSQRKHRPFIAT